MFIIFLTNSSPCSLAVCAFPYILAFTTDSIEIRLVVNGNLVHTAVVPELQLVASRVRHRKTLLGPCVRSHYNVYVQFLVTQTSGCASIEWRQSPSEQSIKITKIVDPI